MTLVVKELIILMLVSASRVQRGCISQFSTEEILARRMDKKELTDGKSILNENAMYT